jgi:hypothetical protein
MSIDSAEREREEVTPEMVRAAIDAPVCREAEDAERDAGALHNHAQCETCVRLSLEAALSRAPREEPGREPVQVSGLLAHLESLEGTERAEFLYTMRPLVDAIMQSRSAPSGEPGRRDGDASIMQLMQVDGASFSVRHPRNDGDLWHFGFSFPMTYEQVIDAVKRGGLGWAPDLETALRNAAAAMTPTEARPHGK